MALYSSFLYGSSVVYGATSTITSLSVDTGPSTGQTAITLLGAYLSWEGDDDTFIGAILDVLKFTDISSGPGAITTNAPNLSLSTGATPGSVAGIETAHPFGDISYEIKAIIPRITQYPDAATNLISMQLYVDASNYCTIGVNVGITSGTMTLDTEVVVAGVTVDSSSTAWTTGVSTFKILRWGNVVQFFANGSIIDSTKLFVTTASTFRYFNKNLTSTYDTLCTVEYVKQRTFVAFDNQIQDEVTVVSPYRIRFSTPASVDTRGVSAAYAGLVDLSVCSQSVTTRSNFFEYYYDSVLTLAVSEQFGTTLSIVDDSTLRTPSGVVKGLGGGR